MVELNARPCDINDVWPLVRERIEPWLECADGGVEAVMQELREAAAVCWRTDQGVLVLSLLPTRGGGVHLFVRVAVSFEPQTDAVEQHLPLLQQMARDVGASQIRFRSTRSGWDRRLPSCWRVSHVEYSMEVDDGRR